MDIGRAFSFVFEDEAWVTKVLLGGLITLIPIVGQLAVLGYMLKTAENVARGSARPLPEWGEFGDLLMRGLYGFVISLVYFIPYIVVVGLFSCLAGVLGSGGSASDSADAVAALGGVLACVFVPLFLIIAFACLLFVYAGDARYAVTGQLSEALKFSEVMAVVRANPGLWFMVLIVNLLSGLAASLGLIACGVGVLFTSFYSYLVLGHALGQTATKVWPTGSFDAPSGYTPPPTVQL